MDVGEDGSPIEKAVVGADEDGVALKDYEPFRATDFNGLTAEEAVWAGIRQNAERAGREGVEGEWRVMRAEASEAEPEAVYTVCRIGENGEPVLREGGSREIRYVKESEIGERDAVSERDFLEDYDRIASENEWKDGYLGSMADLGGDGRGNNVVDRIVGYDADGFRTESGRVLPFDDVRGGSVRVFDPDNVSDLLGMTIVSPAEVSARNVAMDAKDAQRREEYNLRKEADERLSEENNSAERAENGEKVSYNAEPKLDAQGNPVDESGKLIVERIESVNDLTDADFTAPTRSVEMPQLSEEVQKNIGAEGKPFVVKKNVFEKNATNHPEVSAEDSRLILGKVTSETTTLIQDKPNTKPNYWLLVNVGDRNALVLVDADSAKPNVEAVDWYWTTEKSLGRKKKRALRDGGQVIITQEGAADRISALTENSSDGKVTENNSNGKIDAGNSTAKELIEGRAERRREEVREQEGQQAQARAAMSETERLVYDAVSDRLKKSGVEVRVATDEEVKGVLGEIERGGNTEAQIADDKAVVERVNAKFNEELQQQIDGTLPKGHVYQLGRPGAILRSCGFPDVPIELSATRLAEKANVAHHQYSIEEVKDLVNALQDPIAVFIYGDAQKAQNAIIEFTHEGKNFVVGVHFNQQRNGIVISDVRGLYPKDNAEWLNWITQGKSLYLNKEKIQTLIDQQRRTLAEVDYMDLNSVAKIINNFENPKQYASEAQINGSEIKPTEQSIKNVEATIGKRLTTRNYDNIVKINPFYQLIWHRGDMPIRYLPYREVFPNPTLEDYYIHTATEFKNIGAVFSDKVSVDEVRRKNMETWERMKSSGKYEFHESPKSHSEYLIDRESGDIYRYSDHWGDVASCEWKLDVLFDQKKFGDDYKYLPPVIRVDAPLIGKSNIKDFSENKLSEYNLRTVYERNAEYDKTYPVALRSAIENYSALLESGVEMTEPVRRRVEEQLDGYKKLYDLYLDSGYMEDHNTTIESFRTSDGRLYGWADNDGVVHLTKDGLRANTQIHEYTHLWSRMLKRRNPKRWQEIVDLCRSNDMLWNDVANDPNYAHLNGDADKITSEIISRYSGREGARRLEGVARRMFDDARKNGTMKDGVSVGAYISRVKQGLLSFWNRVAEMLGIRRFKNLREVERSVIGDLMNGRKFSADEVRSSANEHAFYGRKGAENLDAARGDRVNQENLSVAERMEQAGTDKTMVNVVNERAEQRRHSDTYKLTNQKDEKGNYFIQSSNGSADFGEIKGVAGLKDAPIRLSEGNMDYGRVHINDRHGQQIRNAGFNSVEEFVENVASNFNTIRKGTDRLGNKTYLLELTDEHNNTLYVELSQDGGYWNVNSAGVFRRSYSKNKEVVWSRPALATGDSATPSVVSHSANAGGVGTEQSGNSTQTTSESKSTKIFAGDNRYSENNSSERLSSSVADPLGNARERVQRRRSNSSLDDFIAQELGMTAERMSQSLQELPQRVRDGMEDRLNGIGERLERIGALDATERELDKMFTEEYDWSQREQTREAVEEHLRQVRNERELLVNEIRSLEEELDNTLLNRDLFYEDTSADGLRRGERSNDSGEQSSGTLGEDYEPFRATDFNGLTAEEAVWAGIRQNAEHAGREGVEGLRRVAQTMRTAYEAVRKGMGIAEGNAKDMDTWLRALVALSDGEFSKGQVKRLLSAARKGTKAEQTDAMRSAVDVLSRHYVRACKERMLSLLDLGNRSSDGGMRVAGATVGREQVTLSSAKRYILDDGLDRVERREALNEELSRLGDSDADLSRREDIEAELAGLDLAEAYDRSARAYERRVTAIEEDINEINGKYYEQRGIQYCIPLCICSNQIFILTLWSIGDSNSLPLRCERSALPDELIPQKCNAKLRLFIEISNLKKEYEKNNSNYRNGIMYINARLH